MRRTVNPFSDDDDAGHHRVVGSVAFSPSGDTLCAGSTSCLQLWDVAQARCTWRADTSHGGIVACLSWCGSVVASGGTDGVVALRDSRMRPIIAANLCHHRAVTIFIPPPAEAASLSFRFFVFVFFFGRPCF
jgi:WD40 repeat protein